MYVFLGKHVYVFLKRRTCLFSLLPIKEKRPAASATDLFKYLYIYIRAFVPYDLMSCTERHHQYVFTIIVFIFFFVIPAANIGIV